MTKHKPDEETPEKFNPEHAEIELLMSSLKGDYNNDQSAKKLLKLTSCISYIITKSIKDDKKIIESEMMHALIPESRGKTGKELELYRTIFNDAMYILYSTIGNNYPELIDDISEWKTLRGYDDGR
jgi:hypothetical protein